MNNIINEQLFIDIEKRMEKDRGGSLWGTSHPVNVLLNMKDEIIAAYKLYSKIMDEKTAAEEKLKKIKELLK